MSHSLWVSRRTANGDVSEELRHIRGLTPTEVAAIKDAIRLCTAVFQDAKVHDLQAAFDQFGAATKKILTSVIGGTNKGWESLPETVRSFDSFVIAFKSFDDQNRSWLSKTFSDDVIVSEYASIASKHYDANAAYRLFTQLRNTATHTGHAINATNLDAELQPNGSRLYRLTLAVDGPKFAKANNKMNARVRREVAEVSGLMDVVQASALVMESCHLIHAEMIQTLQPQIEDAIRILRGISSEVTQHQAETCLVVGDADMRNSRFDLGIKVEFTVSLPDEIEQALEHSLTGAALEPPSSTMEDLVHPSSFEIVIDQSGQVHSN